MNMSQRNDNIMQNMAREVQLLEYDNKIESLEKDGISYVLCNNIWGTNFPLWYEDNARFEFSIKVKNKTAFEEIKNDL